MSLIRFFNGVCLSGANDGFGKVLVSFVIVVSLWIGWPRPGYSETQPGMLILVGDVLRFNQRDVWNRIAGQAADLAIIAAASDRPKLYGDFARRALERHGAFADLLPVALDPSEFDLDHRRATSDPTLAEKVREASGVFFVGGAPQRLARVLVRRDGSPTEMTSAVADAYGRGAVIVGGIPGSVGLSTGVDALQALASGHLPHEQFHSGLGLMTEGWFVDQHTFTSGRFAEVLVAMRQLGIPLGLGIGANTAAVVHRGWVEVIGDEGILVFDLSDVRAAAATEYGFGLAGARISYLEEGDRLEMSTLSVTPAAVKLDGFEIESNREILKSSRRGPPDVQDLFARGGLQRLLREALDGSRREAYGLAAPDGAAGDDMGFRFRFHSLPETVGWLSVDSGIERYTIVNLGLEVFPERQNDITTSR